MSKKLLNILLKIIFEKIKKRLEVFTQGTFPLKLERIHAIVSEIQKDTDDGRRTTDDGHPPETPHIAIAYAD